MTHQLGESIALEPKPDEQQLHPERGDLKAPRADLVEADPFLLGMRMGNLIYAAVFGVVRRERN